MKWFSIKAYNAKFGKMTYQSNRLEEIKEKLQVYTETAKTELIEKDGYSRDIYVDITDDGKEIGTVHFVIFNDDDGKDNVTIHGKLSEIKGLIS